MTTTESFTIAAVGQSAVKRDIRTNSEPRFHAVREILQRADVAFTNLETTIHGAFGGWPTKPGHIGISQPYVLDALQEMGFNALSLANNHAFDLGPNGVLSTFEEAERRGFLHAGVGRDLTAAAKGSIRQIGGRNVALVAIDAGPAAEYIFAKDATDRVPSRPGVNYQRVLQAFVVTADELDLLRRIKNELGHEQEVARYRKLSAKTSQGSFQQVVDVEDDELNFYGMRFKLGSRHERRGIPDQDDLARNLDAIRQAKQSADFVIAYLHHHHWEAQWEQVPDWTRQFAHDCIDAGADIYLSHGVPLMLGIEIYRERPIFYSLGNFIFHSFNNANWFHDHIWRSIVATCRFGRDGQLAGIEIDPIVIGGEESLAAKDFTTRDVPHLASEAYGTEIVSHLATLSAAFGTKVRVDKGRGFIGFHRD
jgi:poly-gamma-glutamate synthesis protein (capsule biosynthesis protein)